MLKRFVPLLLVQRRPIATFCKTLARAIGRCVVVARTQGALSGKPLQLPSVSSGTG